MPPNVKHLILGGHVPVDMTPLALHLCAGPWKVTPLALHRDEENQEASSKAVATVGARLSPPRRHLRICTTNATGTSTTTCRATVESRWSAEQLEHGNRPLRHDRKIDNQRRTATVEIHSFLQSEPQAPCHINVPLVHTGHDVEHLGPDDRREKYSARCRNTRKTNQTHATGMVDDERTVLLVQSCHDAEHRLPVETRRRTAGTRAAGAQGRRKEEVLGSFRFLRFFLFLLLLSSKSRACSTASAACCCTSDCTSLRFAVSFFAFTSFLLAANEAAVRNQREEESTTSAALSARPGKDRDGAPSTGQRASRPGMNQCNGSSRGSGRVPGGRGVGARTPECVSSPASSTEEVFLSPWGFILRGPHITAVMQGWDHRCLDALRLVSPPRAQAPFTPPLGGSRCAIDIHHDVDR